MIRILKGWESWKDDVCESPERIKRLESELSTITKELCQRERDGAATTRSCSGYSVKMRWKFSWCDQEDAVTDCDTRWHKVDGVKWWENGTQYMENPIGIMN